MLFCLPAIAQQNDDNCFAGSNAVFVYNTVLPDTATNSLLLFQRREREGNTAWVTIRRFHNPDNATDVLANYEEARQLLPGFEQQLDVAEAWRKWKRYGTFDSLLNEVGFLPGQLAFHIVLADTTVKAGSTYQYRIIKETETAIGAEERAGNWVSFPARLQTPAPRFLRRQAERDAVMLQWYVTGAMPVQRFQVYRAEGNDNTFELLDCMTGAVQKGDTLIYNMQDNKAVFSEMYRYYIVPLNAFGGGGNIVSDTVPATCMNPNELLTPQFVRADANTDKQAIMVHYLLPDPGYIGSVHIMRSNSFSTGFEEVGITGPADTLFADYRIVPGKKYYYYLQMTDKMGRNSARSVKTFGMLQDTTNDAPARFVTATRIREGVLVSWQNAPDTSVISGYYIYRKASGSERFERISELLPVRDSINEFLDSSTLLQSATLYMYSVVSENLSNKVSAFSVPAYVTGRQPQGKRILLSPREVKVLMQNQKVRLIWYDMKLMDNSFAFYNIYRKSDRDTSFRAVAFHYPAEFTSFMDSTTEPGISYVYAIECADEDSTTGAQTITARINIPSQPLLAPELTASASENSILLIWQQNTDARVRAYGVYRYTRGNEPEKIATVNAEILSFEDSKADKGKTYYYYLQPDKADNTMEVVMSNKVYVVY
ncbi:hypothetical protein FLA_6090 [Filimonas lacunae]|nr:hypothetical protein FLA_6090 [Filimonas lacunae]